MSGDIEAMTIQDWVQWYSELLARCDGEPDLLDIILDQAAEDDDIDIAGYDYLYYQAYPDAVQRRSTT